MALWKVVGGTKDGILVRVGRELDSDETKSRLSRGATFRQLDLQGERLQYVKETGKGPKTGWVSLKVNGKPLVEKLEDAFLDLPHVPEQNAKIFFISSAFKGHIVHFRRICDFFADRPGYECHFTIYPSCNNEKDLPKKASNVFIHAVADDEVGIDEMFTAAQGAFRDNAMQKKDDSMGGFATSMTTHMISILKAGKDPMQCLYKFMLRTLEAVKPDIIVTEGAVCMHGILCSWCFANKVPYATIQCPGIPENLPGFTESMNESAMDKFQPEDMALLMGIPTEDAKKMMEAQKSGDTKSASGGATPTTLMGLLQVLDALPPQIGAMLNKPIADKLQVRVPIWAKMRRELLNTENRTPCNSITIYPSSQNIVKAPADVFSLFTGPLLPLPEPLENGFVQRGRDDVKVREKPEEDAIINWIFEGEDDVPVIYMAFGTMVRPNADLFKKLVDALNDGPWRVLWALPKDTQHLLPADPPLDPTRWRVEAFVPQLDVLKCNRIRCFVSHCGMNSTLESLAAGVPMVCCPFYMDQYEWAGTICNYRKAGVQVDKHGSAADIRRAVNNIFSDPAYRENAQLCSTLMIGHADAVLKKLGPAMKPSAKLGPGTACSAALIMLLLRGPTWAKEDGNFVPTKVGWQICELIKLVKDCADQAAAKAGEIKELKPTDAE